jgi:hypothetical protein
VRRSLPSGRHAAIAAVTCLQLSENDLNTGRLVCSAQIFVALSQQNVTSPLICPLVCSHGHYVIRRCMFCEQ